MSRGWRIILGVVAPGILLAAHVALRDEYFTLVSALCAGVLATITLFAWVRYAAIRPPRLPILESAVFYHYLHYGLPVTASPLSLGIWDVTPTSSGHETASLIGVASVIALISSHAFVIKAFRGRVSAARLPVLGADELVTASRFFVPVASAIVMAISLIPALKFSLAGSIGTVFGIFTQVPLAVVAALAYFARPSRATLTMLVVAFAVIGIATAVTSMLSEFVLPAAVVAVIWWVARRRLPVLLAASTIGLVLLVQPVKSFYRTMNTNGTELGVVGTWREAFTRASEAEESSPYEATVHRLSELSVLAYTVDLVPAAVPYTGGKSYPIILMALVPRIIWPDKPDITAAATDAFTIALGLQTVEWAEKSKVALSVPPHGYLEHGLFGAIGWMAIVGFIHGLVSHLFPIDHSGYSGLLGGGLLLGRVVFGYDGGLVAFVTTCVQWIIYAVAFSWLIFFVGRAVRRQAVARNPIRADVTT